MPISRPVLLALIATILAAAAFLATSSSRQASAPAPAPAVKQPKPAVKKPAKADAAAKPAAKAEAKAPAKETKAAAKPEPKPKAAAKPEPKPAAAKPKVEGVPAGVASALDRNRVVVLFFRQSGSADDRAVAAAVAAQRGRKGVSVFSDSITKLSRYRAVVESLAIAQAPAVVIVNRQGQAHVVEGYIDRGTLTQQVVDAR